MSTTNYVLLAALCLCGGNALSQTTQSAELKIDSLFAVYNNRTPGVAIAIVKDGAVVLQKGYGMANLEHDIPITPQTVFNIASVSKQFTAFAVYLLEHERKLSFEDDVRKWIPELPDYGDTIRIKHLMAHTSGLRDQAALTVLSGHRLDDVSTTGQVLKLAARQTQLNYRPGTTFSYSNTGYTLLAEIVHRVTGKSFATFTRESIFAPLGMTNTRFCDNHELMVKNRAESYERDNDIYYRKPLNSASPGASNLLTTAEDLTKWVLNFERPVVGNEAMIRAFNAPSYYENGQKVVMRVLAAGDTIFHAKGQNISTHKGVPMMSHGGHAAAFRTFLGRFPDQRLSIIALSNDEHNERLGGRWQIADFYIPEYLTEEKETPPASAPRKSAEPAAVEYSSSLQDFEGEFYSDEVKTGYSFKLLNQQLVMQHIRLNDIPLVRSGENRFTGYSQEVFPFEIVFQRNESAAVTGFLISNFGAKNMKFARLGDMGGG